MCPSQPGDHVLDKHGRPLRTGYDRLAQVSSFWFRFYSNNVTVGLDNEFYKREPVFLFLVRSRNKSHERHASTDVMEKF